MPPRRLLLSFVAFTVAVLGLSSLPDSAIAQGGLVLAQGSCPVSGVVYRLDETADDLMPAGGVALLTLAGGSTLSDSGGRWTLSLNPGRAVVRIVMPFNGVIGILNSGRVVDAYYLDAGTTDLEFVVLSTCTPYVIDYVQQARYEGPVSRPNPPELPVGFVPSDATLAATVPPAGGGNAANVSWIGYFWLTAPVVRVGVCNIVDVRIQAVVDLAIRRWQEAPGLGWQLVRDDNACQSDAPLPRLLITTETNTGRFSNFILGSAPAADLNGNKCTVDLSGSACWVGTGMVKLNPQPFTNLAQDQQIATVLHEIGHAFGLAHSRGCGDSVMWYDTACKASPKLFPGADDIASLNELLAATLTALQRRPATAPTASPDPPSETGEPSPPMTE